MKRPAASRICFLLLVGLIVFSSPVRADIAPPPAPQGSNILPDAVRTHVRMAAETVFIEALPNPADQAPEASVTARFQMRNMGTADESMMVRFPLNLTQGVCDAVSDYRPLQDFEAWVDGDPAPITIDRQIPNMGYPWDEVTDCWANFPAAFPAGKDVEIQVRYTQEASPSYYTVEGFVMYPYILQTGAGWYDTIGSADIVFRAPWTLESENLIDWSPADGGYVTGNEIRWHFENFEPDDLGDNIYVTIINPAIWSALNRARRDTAANPQDGEAWGRLGKALKEMTVARRGVYREDYYWESFAAYQKAVELKPWDADWHYGFAELICSQMSVNGLAGTQPTDDFERDCFNQLKATLQINPRHEKAIEYLMDWAGMDCPSCISKYGLDSLIGPALTEVYATREQHAVEFSSTLDAAFPGDTPTVPPAAPQHSKTPVRNSPVPKSTATPAVVAQVEATLSPTPLQASPTYSPNQGGLCGSILFALSSVVVGWILKKKLF